MTTTAQIKERPLLMKGELVRATMEGRKTQTRRVIKFAPLPNGKADTPPDAIHQDGGGNWIYWWGPNSERLAEFTRQHYSDGSGIPCPYGRPGDRLWVRETYGVTDYEYPGPFQNRYLYRADGERGRDFLADYRWYPSIHMPREACRLVLEITAVRAERLQQISFEDVCAEGVFDRRHTCVDDNWRRAWRLAWDGINAKRGFGWDANPWVWIIEYKVVTHELV